MKVICISGKAGSGKDAFGNMLKEQIEKRGYGVLITHYGDLLKYMCKTLFDWNGEKDKAGRYLLQKVGTDIVRAKKPDFWVKYVSDILHMFSDQWDYVIIPDARFENEIDVLRNDPFFSVTTIRMERELAEDALTEEQKEHASETELDDYPFDYYVYNKGSLDDLRDSSIITADSIIG